MRKNQPKRKAAGRSTLPACSPLPSIQLPAVTQVVERAVEHVALELERIVTYRAENPEVDSFYFEVTTFGEIRCIPGIIPNCRVPYVLESNALVLQRFPNRADAVPVSDFYEVIADSEGAFIGKLDHRGNSSEPFAFGYRLDQAQRKKMAPIWSGLGWQPFRIEPLSRSVALQLVRSADFQRSKQVQLMTWILGGYYHRVLSDLTLAGLHDLHDHVSSAALRRLGGEAALAKAARPLLQASVAGHRKRR